MLAGCSLHSQSAAAQDTNKFYTGSRAGWNVEGTFKGDRGSPICTGRSPIDRPFISITRGVTDPPPSDDVLSLMVSAYQKTSFTHGQRFLAAGTFHYRDVDGDHEITFGLKVVVIKAENGETLYAFATPTWGDANGDGETDAFGILLYLQISQKFILKVPNEQPVSIDLTGSAAAMDAVLGSCTKAYRRWHRPK